jgi:hypothetical protein
MDESVSLRTDAKPKLFRKIEPSDAAFLMVNLRRRSPVGP